MRRVHQPSSRHYRPSLINATALACILQKRGDVDGAIRAMLEYVRLSGDRDGSGKARAAALLEKKKAGGRAAKPDAEAQARSPLRSSRPRHGRA